MILWFGEALLPDGWANRVRVTVSGDRIAEVVSDCEPGSTDERHAVGLPGMGNVHSHAFQRGMAGLSEQRGAPDDDFWSWREVMYRFLDRLDPTAIEAIAALAFAEMLESGYTHVGEFHYLHHDPAGHPYAALATTAQSIAAAAQTTGIGLTLLPVFYAHADFGGMPAKPGQRRFVCDLDGFARLYESCRTVLRPGDRIGLAPHSLRAVTPDELAVLLPLAGEGPVHIHAAEQTKEVDDCVAALGARPVEWLLANAPVNEHWCLVHATHLSPTETDALAASGAVAGLCPMTEANLGDGNFPAVRYLTGGGRMATGTDSNILVDAAAELRHLEYSQRLLHRGRNLLASDDYPSVGRRLFDAALDGGARALGVDLGIAPGCSADIITLATQHPSFAAASGDGVLDRWIFSSRGQAIDAVWRSGRRVVSNGRHHAREAIERSYRAAIIAVLG